MASSIAGRTLIAWALSCAVFGATTTLEWMSGDKSKVMKRQMALLGERNDLSNRAASGVTMSRGKAIQEGVDVNVRWASADGPIKTFPLRGLKDSPPYLHDGRLLTIEDTVEFFDLALQTELTAAEKSDGRIPASALAPPAFEPAVTRS